MSALRDDERGHEEHVHVVRRQDERRVHLNHLRERRCTPPICLAPSDPDYRIFNIDRNFPQRGGVGSTEMNIRSTR